MSKNDEWIKGKAIMLRKKTTNLRHFTCYLPLDLAQELQSRAFQEDSSYSRILKKATRLYLAKQKSDILLN